MPNVRTLLCCVGRRSQNLDSSFEDDPMDDGKVMLSGHNRTFEDSPVPPCGDAVVGVVRMPSGHAEVPRPDSTATLETCTNGTSSIDVFVDLPPPLPACPPPASVATDCEAASDTQSSEDPSKVATQPLSPAPVAEQMEEDEDELEAEDNDSDSGLEDEAEDPVAPVPLRMLPRGVAALAELETIAQKLKCPSAILEKISFFLGDITKIEVDAIVNAANARLEGGGGVDGAIHRAAGYRELQAECKKIKTPVLAGNAVSTDSCGLKSHVKRIIHAVGPICYDGLDKMKKSQLVSCYTNALQICEKEGLRSVAFCCISTGVYCYPNHDAADRVINCVTKYLENPDNRDKFDRIVFVLFMDIDKMYYTKAIREYASDDHALQNRLDSADGVAATDDSEECSDNDKEEGGTTAKVQLELKKKVKEDEKGDDGNFIGKKADDDINNENAPAAGDADMTENIDKGNNDLPDLDKNLSKDEQTISRRRPSTKESDESFSSEPPSKRFSTLERESPV